MTDEKYKKSLKIIARLCKEARVFPGKYYKNIINFVEINNSYVFYGRDKMSYSYNDVEFEEKFFKLQLDLIRCLIENDILEKPDYCLTFSDTLTRYNVNTTFDKGRWTRVAKTAKKKEFFEFFIEKYKEKLGYINKKTYDIVLKGLPKD